jgi:thioredoxin-related protein
MQPVVASLQQNCPANVKFVYADIDQPTYNQLASEYGVRSIPHYVLVDPKGNTVKQWIGTVSYNDLNNIMYNICYGRQ